MKESAELRRPFQGDKVAVNSLPYIYAGTAVNYVGDPMKMNCIRVGDYMSYNAGAGVKYYITNRINVGYNIGFGYLNRDDVDFMSHDAANDMYVQNTLMIGIDLF